MRPGVIRPLKPSKMVNLRLFAFISLKVCKVPCRCSVAWLKAHSAIVLITVTVPGMRRQTLRIWCKKVALLHAQTMQLCYAADCSERITLKVHWRIDADLNKVPVGIQNRGKSSGANKDFGLNVQVFKPDLHS